MKSLIKLFLPPLFILIYRKLLNKDQSYSVPYPSWQQAKKMSLGYDSNVILENAYKEFLKFKNNKEYKLIGHYLLHIFTCLVFVINNRKSKKLHICDFGGGYGGIYFNYKKSKIFSNKEKNNILWSVVEQKSHVDFFKKKIVNKDTSELFFFENIKEVVKKKGKVNLFLLSSVIQYLSEPYNFLNEVVRHKAEYILITKTPFSKSSKEEIRVQKNPKLNGTKTNYPLILLVENQLKEFLEKNNYELIEEFYNFEEVNPNVSYHKTLFFRRNNLVFL